MKNIHKRNFINDVFVLGDGVKFLSPSFFYSREDGQLLCGHVTKAVLK